MLPVRHFFISVTVSICQGMDRPGVRQIPESNEEQGKMEKTGCKIICGASTTLAVKGLMMMMMMMMMICQSVLACPLTVYVTHSHTSIRFSLNVWQYRPPDSGVRHQTFCRVVQRSLIVNWGLQEKLFYFCCIQTFETGR